MYVHVYIYTCIYMYTYTPHYPFIHTHIVNIYIYIYTHTPHYPFIHQDLCCSHALASVDNVMFIIFIIIKYPSYWEIASFYFSNMLLLS